MEEDVAAGLDQSKREEKLQQGVVRKQRSVEYKKKEAMDTASLEEAEQVTQTLCLEPCLEPRSICVFLRCSYPQH